MNSKKENVLAQLKAALERFEDVLSQPKSEFMRDSAIQRFEFTFELAWKTLKTYLEEKGVRAYSPRDAIKGAFQVGLIPEDNKWIEMIETRNLTSHIYKEDMAEDVYKKLPSYVPAIKKLCEAL